MSCLKEIIYERYNEYFNVLSDNKKRAILTFDGNDLSVVVDKVEKKILIQVPLTKAHGFEYHGDWLLVDGERIESDMYWVEFGCQIIEYQGDASKVIASIMGEIKHSFKI